MAEEKTKVEKKVLVLSELPQQQVREFSDDKSEYSCVTVEEALTEILESIRDIRSKL